ncbi:MAG: hypothetical protein KAR21_23715, partial [Spirochaetales bacterium]|nr:hypothetical protein [Spirochaetales bacterium]
MKMLITLFFCIISIFTVSASGQVEFHQGEDGYTWFEKKGITMKWKIESESLNVILSAATEGWVAVGFIQGLVKEKEGADLIIAYVDGGKTFIRDDFAYSA